MVLLPALEFVPYPEVAEARSQIVRFLGRTESMVGTSRSDRRTATRTFLYLHGPAGNGKSHILRALTSRYRARVRTDTDDCDPVWCIDGGDLINEVAHHDGDWISVAERYSVGGALLIDRIQLLSGTPVSRICLGRMILAFLEKGRPIVLAETTEASPDKKTSVMQFPELAWLTSEAQFTLLSPPGAVGTKLLVRHFGRNLGYRLPLPVVEALAASVLRFERISASSCEQVTRSLAAWCIFHDVKPDFDALSAMRSAGIRSAGLDPRRPE